MQEVLPRTGGYSVGPNVKPGTIMASGCRRYEEVGRPRRRPDRVTADRGYDHDKYRRELRRRGIASEIARRKTEHGSGLGRVRWVVERTFAWLHHFKRLLVRYDRRHEIHEAFLAIGCCLVCFRRLQNSL